MKAKNPNDSAQLNLFGDVNDSASRKKIEDLDQEIDRLVTARDPHAAKAAAQKQEQLLKKILQEKKGKKAKGA